MAASPVAPKADLTVAVQGLRNDHGSLLLCLTRRGANDFLKCDKDPAKVARVIAATESNSIHFDGLEPGEYCLLLVHDENRNGKLDTMMGIPREGFAFSRNPAMRMGPPHYQDVHFPLPGGESHLTLKVKYLL